MIKSKLAQRAKRILLFFKITLSEWKTIFNYQKQVCFICGMPKSTYHTDHDHETGLVRGILCGQCNRALGKAQDPRWRWTPMCFYRAYIYLTNPPAVEALQKKVFTFPGKLGTKRHRNWLKKGSGIQPTNERT